MLYDTRWGKSDADKSAFDAKLDDLISWLRTKPADGTYDYTDPEKCMLCQYLVDHGVERPYVNPNTWGREGNVSWWTFSRPHMRALPEHFNEIASANIRGDYTFGAALQRALDVRELELVSC